MGNFNKLKQGEVLSETQYYTVDKKVGDQVQLSTDDGETIIVNSGYVNTHLDFASQFDKEEKVTKTKLAEIVLENPRIVMEINFNKQVKPEEVTKGLVSIYDNFSLGMTKTEYRNQVKQALDLKGEERTIIGRHYGQPNELGRISFVDMNIKRDSSKGYDNRLRQVDPRTVNYVIVNNIKYILKK